MEFASGNENSDLAGGSPSDFPPTGDGSTENPAASCGAWTFLSNHSHVLLCTRQRGDITAREIADLVGITERAVQRILADLISGGFVSREKRGRQNVYTVLSDKRLRHPLEEHCTIGGLLDFLTSGKTQPTQSP